jgi:hypothetical protein
VGKQLLMARLAGENMQNVNGWDGETSEKQSDASTWQVKRSLNCKSPIHNEDG